VRVVPPLVARARAHAGRFPRVFWLLLVVGAARELGSGVFIPYWALYLTESLGASGAQAGALLGIAGGVGLVGAPLGGILTDRIGRRKTLLLALGGTAAGFVAYGSLSSLVAVAIVSPFWGITSDLESPAVSAAIADVVEPDLRAEAFGLRQQANNMAFALGPPLGSLLLLGLPLRAVFVFAGVAAFVGLVLVWVRLPETKPDAPADEEPRFRNALRDRRLLALAAGAGISVAVYAVFDGALGPFLHDERGYAISTWGLLFTLNPVVIGVAQYPVARWAGSRSPRAMLALGIVVQGSALAALWPLEGIAFVAGAVLLLTVGEMLLAPITSALAVSLAPAHLRGSYEGVLNVAYASMWAPGVFGGLWLVGGGQGELLLALCLPLALVGAACFLPLPRRPVPVQDALPAAPEAAVAAP
jgi:predicted MFS family arabinose efflux permease